MPQFSNNYPPLSSSLLFHPDLHYDYSSSNNPSISFPFFSSPILRSMFTSHFDFGNSNFFFLLHIAGKQEMMWTRWFLSGWRAPTITPACMDVAYQHQLFSSIEPKVSSHSCRLVTPIFREPIAPSITPACPSPFNMWLPNGIFYFIFRSHSLRKEFFNYRWCIKCSLISFFLHFLFISLHFPEYENIHRGA